MKKNDTPPERRLFPNFKSIPEYQDIYRAFREQYQAEYVQKILSPSSYNSYTCRVEKPEDVFLIYLPSDASSQDAVTFITPIVYVESYDKLVGIDVTQNSYRFSRFELSPYVHGKKLAEWKDFSDDEPFVPYEDMIAHIGDKRTLRTAEHFNCFNSEVVFQLQPEHFHYFAPFFAHFKPFQDKMKQHPHHMFLNAAPPKNTL